MGNIKKTNAQYPSLDCTGNTPRVEISTLVVGDREYPCKSYLRGSYSSPVSGTNSQFSERGAVCPQDSSFESGIMPVVYDCDVFVSMHPLM